MKDDEIAKRIHGLVAHYERTILTRLEKDFEQEATLGDKVADGVSSFGGSWRFIIGCSLFLGLWIGWNSLRWTPHFDRYPFIFLNLSLSFVAAFQAPFIMMSQARQAARDKREAIIDFAINFKTEQDLTRVRHRLAAMEQELLELRQQLEQAAGQRPQRQDE